MKPEILVFCLLPWIILCLDNYFDKRSSFSLLLAAPLLSVLVTSKGTIAFILFITLIPMKNLNISKLKICLPQ